MAELLPFPKPNEPCEPLEILVKRAHELSKKSQNVFWDCPHAQLRMRERKVTIQQVLDVLRKGNGIDGPTLDKYGDWRIKLKRFTAGRDVQVVVVVKKDHLEVVTVI